MLVIGAERGHPPPAHLMDSLAPCVHLVNTAPQVTTFFHSITKRQLIPIIKKIHYFSALLYF